MTKFQYRVDREGRSRRGRRIVALLSAVTARDLTAMRVLDVGCANGLVTREIALHTIVTAGVDVDLSAIEDARCTSAGVDRLAFACASGEALPFRDEAFDLVICNHVYEHVGDPRTLMREIARVLKPDGLCWFAAGHTLQIVEPHYRLPLLSMLPRGLASAILKATGRGSTYDVRFVAPWRVRSMFVDFAAATLVSVDAMRDPLRFDLAYGLLRFVTVRVIVSRFAWLAAWLAPTQLWILYKHSASE